ncbi:uncharacterized protein LOC117582100 [Drosophila guanche]|uniref:Uncharacterized protein n=1 Tax=Drosophila guanche TaxID=7266 RepID=A0A3B0J2D8_DROGU|nr:uncharacterized protein LOC117582100 [Drosophila guanche]XP_034125566.1 uncharacterized protein LOC117582100 [Drosophila guanche]XP_034125576.1 uncharacterized protein LOC117582100 [Drosophila guanche]XP_034125584.1 uncharacterized protein LOC117582100 [Drosophila guanche]SPP75564.1 Hypothetical predicted protein [Drosophila guanche]
MPICKSSGATASKKAPTDISADHVTEAAQVKRTREQAYFNSYDFDAIEVLPYDEDGDGDDGDAASRSSGRYSVPHEPLGAPKFAYLQRLGAFFGRPGGAAPVGGAVAEATTAAAGGIATGLVASASNDNFLLPRAMLKYQSAATTSMPLTTLSKNGIGTGTGTGMGNGIGHDNPHKMTVSAAGVERSKKCSIASNVSSTPSTDSGLPASAAAAKSATSATSTAAGVAAAAAVGGGGSHYSTDKSGSSGYYSSNVCSTYSLDEHIYCEPVIDILGTAGEEQAKMQSVAARQRLRPQLQLPRKVAAKDTAAPLPLPLPPIGGAAAATAASDKLSTVKSQRLDMQDAATGAGIEDFHSAGVNDLQQTAEEEMVVEGLPQYSDKLRILETSIENLDRHLKTFPRLFAQEQSVSFLHSPAATSLALPQLQMDISEKLRVYNQLPTIMEQQQQQQLVDDSLLDIDLDAFLLDPKPQSQSQSQAHPKTKSGRVGIDNPSFLSDEQLEENNYKCAKYINSCPEDAYRVESEAAAGHAPRAIEERFVKRYEDQVHFQSTRELLEDVRDKIRLLSRATPSPSATPAPARTPPPDIPKELEGMIHTLKQELESYLQRMNQHSEQDLRQLCSGLGRQQHVVRLQNALERRRSCADLLHLNAYEAVHDGVLISTSGRPLSVREQTMTIRCASDPNFKMKRKSITEIFPTAECYIETTTLSRSATPTPASTPQLELEALHPPSLPGTMVVTQMQRNLTFHKPILSGAGSSGSASQEDALGGGSGAGKGERDTFAEWHRKKPSIWEMYYGTNRLHQSLLGKQRNGGELVISSPQPTLSYPSSRPESDFTLDLPRAEQLRLKMEKEKKFRQRCRFITTFLSLVFFLLTVMVVSLVLTRGKRMFGSMI